MEASDKLTVLNKYFRLPLFILGYMLPWYKSENAKSVLSYSSPLQWEDIWPEKHCRKPAVFTLRSI